ncbi:hypothetical protein ACFRAM_01420 [Paenibacillus sp. NPDC056722]|uniref:hypothetical protein n=1 Tax=Paenibacillus sp. NPDC056722 TaxID=3345924 RepID=UPI00369A8150
MNNEDLGMKFPSFFKGTAEGFKDVTDYVGSGHFDPTPVQPDIKRQDRVRYTGDVHKLTKGTVRCVFQNDSGHWADVYDRNGVAVHTVRLDKLEVINPNESPIKD